VRALLRRAFKPARILGSALAAHIQIQVGAQLRQRPFEAPRIPLPVRAAARLPACALGPMVPGGKGPKA